MKTKSLGFIGGGRITKIILHALKNREVDLSSVVVYDINSDVIEALKKQFPEILIADSVNETAKQEIVFVALHPPVIMETLDQINDSIYANSIVVSLAPKISFEKIESKLATKNIARMIPNATSYINKAYNPISFSSGFDLIEKQSLIKLLELMGKTFEVEEFKLESYAILSAMLPTYFWFQWEEMQKIGEKMGLSKEESKETIQETLYAAIELFYQSDLNSEEVMDLIPVKPIAEHEATIKECLSGKLLPLFEKIKP